MEVEQLACSVLSMSFFDRLQENGIVRESGHICKCFDDYYEDFTISDKLREVLIRIVYLNGILYLGKPFTKTIFFSACY